MGRPSPLSSAATATQLPAPSRGRSAASNNGIDYLHLVRPAPTPSSPGASPTPASPLAQTAISYGLPLEQDQEE